MPNVDIGAAISQSFQFLGAAWGRAWGILLILVWVTAAIQAVQALRPEWFVLVWPLGLLLTGAASTAAVGALYRIGIESQHSDDPDFRANTGGLQWGGLEWRVLGANLLVGLMFVVADVVIAIIWVVTFGLILQGDQANLQAMQSSDSNVSAAAFLHVLGGPASLLTLAIFLPTFCAQTYFGARLSLVALVAADARSFSFARAWSLTRGAVVAIIVAWIVIGLVAFLASLIVGLLFAAVGAAFGQAAGGGIGFLVAFQAVGAAIGVPLVSGLQLYVYNTRRPGDAGIAATFA